MNNMNMITIISKSLFGGLLVSFFLFFLFVPMFQVQATVGVSCATTACSPAASCRSLIDDPATPPPVIEGGVCIGPCTTDAECAPVQAGLGWGGAKCTGTTASPGVCLELPRSGSNLPATAPATTGEGLLAILDTATNWIFAIFVILSIIFVLLAAFQFVTAGGEATKVGEARQKLIWATIGIAIALAAKGLVPIIRNIIGG